MRLKTLVPLLILLTACSSPATATSVGTRSGQVVASSETGGSSLPPAELPATILPATAAAILTSGSLVLTIVSPLDGSVTDQEQINLLGNVSVNAVLTVNDDIYILPPGDFSIPLILVEGPNALEIVVSDNDGNEVDLILVITYQP